VAPDDETDPTLASPRPNPALDETVGGEELSPRSSNPSLPGYQVSGLIGRGGMGEVVRGHDKDIGRDVAIKRLRGQSHPDAVARFLREAKIQARLEHPAIVPVHAIGRDTDGQPYFTMKRITGRTLAELLASADYPGQKLLRALADACRAVQFAHSRRVVHRDIKPANIMVGDFGEVYLLDWGLARVLDDAETAHTVADGEISLDGSTQAGAMLGTPGYMAPEQVEDAHGVGPEADVYSLGAILFEIMANEPLHKRGSVLTTTLGGTDTSPLERRPDRSIPPELDKLCVDALARDPAKRPTSRELADRLEGFLDGDRDLEARRRIAALELEDAHAAYASGDPSRRSEAVQSAGRALALDPKSRAAADLITRLMLEPPAEQPAGLREQLLQSEIAAQKRQGRVASGSFFAIIAFLGLAAWNGLHDWLMLAILAGFTILLASAAFVVSRRKMSSREILIVTLGNAALVAMLSRMFGSLLLVPGVTCVMMLSLTSYPQNIDRARFVITTLVLSWIIPVVLEWLGILTPTWRVVDNAIISTSSMVRIGGTATFMLMVFANIMTIAVFGLFANRLAVSRRDAQRQVEIQAWHLRQLLPTPRTV